MSQIKTISSQLVLTAKDRKILDAGGDPNVGRLMALMADEDLKLAVSERCLEKSEAGYSSSPRGLMLQINSRIKKALGVSVVERKADSDFQEIVAIIRSACKRQLVGMRVDWDAEDFEKQDKRVKQVIYATIERMAAIYKGSAEKEV